MAAKKKTDEKKKPRKRPRKKGLGSVKLPLVGSVPVHGIITGVVADRLGQRISDAIRNAAPGNKWAQAIAGAPVYLVPALAGYVFKDNSLMAYGLGGLASRFAATAGF